MGDKKKPQISRLRYSLDTGARSETALTRDLGNASNLNKEKYQETDLTGRIGNIRFGVLLLKSDLDGAYSTASRIMDHVSKYIFSQEKKQHLTVSIGGACFPTNLTSKERSDLFKKAEDSFKIAKNKGESIYLPDLPVSKNSGGE